jgi:hypothetical protein
MIPYDSRNGHSNTKRLAGQAKASERDLHGHGPQIPYAESAIRAGFEKIGDAIHAMAAKFGEDLSSGNLGGARGVLARALELIDTRGDVGTMHQPIMVATLR